MREHLTLDTPDGPTEQTVYSCDVCGEYDRQVMSYYWSQSGDVLQQKAEDSEKHVCEDCLRKFVDPF